MEVKTYYCDVCKERVNLNFFAKIPVIFVTEQTEGRPIKPYIDMATLDLCDTCKDRVLDGNFIFAAGAQGYNRYYFKSKEVPE